MYENDCFAKGEYLNICSSGSKPEILYGHKPVKKNCPFFPPILQAIDTSTYDLDKFPVYILKPLTQNEYTVHDSFLLTSKISKFNSKNLMASLNVQGLFTNIPLEETIDNIVNDSFLPTGTFHSFERQELRSNSYVDIVSHWIEVA